MQIGVDVAVADSGRGSQHDGLRAVAAPPLPWQSPSGVAEDHNAYELADNNVNRLWRSPSGGPRIAT